MKKKKKKFFDTSREIVDAFPNMTCLAMTLTIKNASGCSNQRRNWLRACAKVMRRMIKPGG